MHESLRRLGVRIDRLREQPNEPAHGSGDADAREGESGDGRGVEAGSGGRLLGRDGGPSRWRAQGVDARVARAGTRAGAGDGADRATAGSFTRVVTRQGASVGRERLEG